MTFVFKMKDVSKLVKHALNAKSHVRSYGEDDQETSPELWLVHDAGVYLMSNGRPPLKVRKGKGNQVVYAEGHDASTWMGGDDFVQPIPLDDWPGWKNKTNELMITITDTEVSWKLI